MSRDAAHLNAQELAPKQTMPDGLRLGVLFSGGKDSTLALFEAMHHGTIVCLISLKSKNSESYLFHTPNNSLLDLQAQALGLPLLVQETTGEKEKEVADLALALARAKAEFKLDGVVTGAVGSVYQATRIQKVCDELSLWCFNPLWQRKQLQLLQDVVDSGMQAIIAGVFAEPLDESYLGERIDSEMIERLAALEESHKINPAGEGGEIETTVLDAPFFSSRIIVEDVAIQFENCAGTYEIKKASLIAKRNLVHGKSNDVSNGGGAL